LSPTKKKSTTAQATPAAQAGTAFDPFPTLSDAELTDLVHQPRRIVETERPPPPRIIGREEMLRLVPLSFPKLIDEMVARRFPRARKISPQKIGWLEEEYMAWRANLPLQTYKGDKKLDDET